jgi:copper(I)-binding protein
MRIPIRRVAPFAALFAAVVVSGTAAAAVTVSAPWLRATPPGVSVGAGYATLSNDGDQARKIVRVETAVASSAMIHSMKSDQGMMQMRELDGLTVPAHGSVQLAPGSYHLMLMGLKQPLVSGQSATLVFVLDDGTQLKADFPVRAAAP